MNDLKSDSQKLCALINAVEDDILKAEDEEILEDIKKAEESPEQIINSVRNIIGSVITAHGQKMLHAARASYDAVTTDRSVVEIPEEPQACRKFLQQLIDAGMNLPNGVTLAFREGQDMSDEDVKTILEDLAALGVLENKKE